MKRYSNPAIEKARRKQAKASQKSGSVNMVKYPPPLAARHNTTPKGSIVQRYIKAKRQRGDTQPMFGKDIVAFKGGEGGRNWSINATIVS